MARTAQFVNKKYLQIFCWRSSLSFAKHIGKDCREKLPPPSNGGHTKRSCSEDRGTGDNMIRLKEFRNYKRNPMTENPICISTNFALLFISSGAKTFWIRNPFRPSSNDFTLTADASLSQETGFWVVELSRRATRLRFPLD
ncbi:hypothetical protein CEXT_800791 [Caerostris extrusa]|uniref:Uncharacterized protein n=1 Tax=Caerostris extrusa TaxID=172846 RepID=A0AAV4XM76_CAEEX|nr:hypothetical protein CEXT_800791 [Caerostris extrusa]